MLWEVEGYFDPDSDELRPGLDRDNVLASCEGRAARELASHLVIKGFNYEGLSKTQCLMLDSFGCLMWSEVAGSASLSHELDAKQLSESWLSPRVVEELLIRTGDFKFLRYVAGSPPVRGTRLAALIAFWMSSRTPVRRLLLLENGRRFGTEAEPTQGGTYYVVFSPAELVELRHEVEVAINAAMPWQEPDWQPKIVERELLIPLQKTIKAGRWGVMTWAP